MLNKYKRYTRRTLRIESRKSTYLDITNVLLASES